MAKETKLLLGMQVADLRTAYGGNPTANLPASIQSGQRAASSAAAAPPPGSLLASPVLLSGTTSATWRARFRAAVAALLATPADLAGNPQGPEVLHAYGDTLDHSKVRAVGLACHPLHSEGMPCSSSRRAWGLAAVSRGR